MEEILSNLKDLYLESKPPLILTNALLITLSALICGYFIFKFKGSSPFSPKKLPPGSFGLPLIGETISFVRAQKQNKTAEWIQNRVNKHGPVFKTSIIGSKVVVMTGQAGNRFVFSGGDGALSLNQPKSVTKILGKYSLFEISGQRHKLIRGAMAAFVKPESIQRYLGEMESVIQQKLTKELDGKDSVHAVALMKRIAFNVICSVFFGIPDDNNEREVMLKEFTTTVKGAWTVPLDIPGTAFNTALRTRKRLCEKLSYLISMRRKYIEQGTAHEDEDVITSLLNLRDENGQPLLEDEILDLSISLIMASHDTITVVLCLFVRQLASDDEVYKRVLEEHKAVANAKRIRGEEKLTWNEILTMKYTWRVAQELIRLNPPIFGSFRQVVRDFKYEDYDIPKGWQVLWVTCGTHMDNNIFKDPYKFEPSRFESSSRSYPPYTYIPFGAGPRICPGADFARAEIILVIHYMITKYQWTQMIPDEPITREPIPFPAMGLPIILHPRE